MAIDWHFINYRTADMNYYNNNAAWWEGQARGYNQDYININGRLTAARKELAQAQRVKGYMPGLTSKNNELKNRLNTLADRVSQAMSDDGASQKIKDLNKDFEGQINNANNTLQGIIDELNTEITNLGNDLRNAKSNLDHANERAATQRANAAQASREIWRERNAG